MRSDLMFYRRRAFSLVEVFIVITIIAILAAIAAPRWIRSIERYEVDLAAKRIAADIALAQSRANYSSTTVTISFLPQSNSYQIVGMPDFSHPNQTYNVNLAASPYNVALGAVNFGGTQQLTFDGYGTPTRGGSVVVTVADCMHTITVDATSGRVTIQ